MIGRAHGEHAVLQHLELAGIAETAPVAVEGYIGTTFANWNELAAAGVVLVVADQ